jgi:alkylation response protein AidB-like acyl-CoA dehydrogenase
MAKTLRHTSLRGPRSRCGQPFGGLGFTRELSADGTAGSVEAIYRDSKIGEIYEGTNEIQKWTIARNIFGKEITG